MDRRVYTDWKDYVGDTVVKPVEAVDE